MTVFSQINNCQPKKKTKKKKKKKKKKKTKKKNKSKFWLMRMPETKIMYDFQQKLVQN